MRADVSGSVRVSTLQVRRKVYVDVKPKKISDVIRDITVYSNPCR